MSSLKSLEERVNQAKDNFKKIKTSQELLRPDELVDDYVDGIVKAKEHPLSFGLPTIDAELRGDLRGKVAAIIGYGGTKKSLLCLNMVNHAAHHQCFLDFLICQLTLDL
jgi:hypothetical protein